LCIVLVGCNKGGPATPASPQASDAVIGPNGIAIDGKQIPIPFTNDQIVAALGLPSRSLKRDAETILTWDDKGFVAHIEGTDQGRVWVECLLEPGEGVEYWPKKPFTHAVWLNGVQLTTASKEPELKAAGLERRVSATFLWLGDIGSCSLLFHTDLKADYLTHFSVHEKKK